MFVLYYKYLPFLSHPSSKIGQLQNDIDEMQLGNEEVILVQNFLHRKTTS